MVTKFGLLLIVPMVLGLAACTAADEHEAACVGGTLAGAAIGGAIGNQFGGGSGQAILTGVGAFAGASTAANSMNCAR